MKSSLLIATVLAICISMPASAQIAKEGSQSFTYFGFGTSKATQVGKDRLLTTLDKNGLSVGQGIFDHMTWHCWGSGDFTNGVGQHHGYCVTTDTGGDQIVIETESEKHSLQTNFSIKAKFTAGTGKYTGISGENTCVLHGNEFRPASAGTFFDYERCEGSYKLP